MLFNKRVLGEDRPMVISQDPIRTELNMDELLVPGDSPIIEFRKRRQELKKAAEEQREPAPMTGRTNASPRLLQEIGLGHLAKETKASKSSSAQPLQHPHAA